MENQNQQVTTEGVVQPKLAKEFTIRDAFHEGGEAMYFIAIVGIATLVLTISRFMAFAKMAISKEDVARVENFIVQKKRTGGF